MRKKFLTLIAPCLSVFILAACAPSTTFTPPTTEAVESTVVSETPTDVTANAVDEDEIPELTTTDEPVATEPDDVIDATEIRIQFVGDILLHPRYTGSVEVARTSANSFNFHPFLEHIAEFIDGDLAIANMETPVDVMGNNQDLSTFPFFNVPFEILPALVDTGFNHLISANNHSFDRGFSGLAATVANFERAGISHTGMNVSFYDFNTHTIIDVGGIKVGIIAYTDSVNGLESFVTDAEREFAVRRFRSYTLDDIPRIEQDINKIRNLGAEFVIISLHWGAEYVDYPTEMQRLIARQISEAGADVIMGNHAHVVQPVEWHYREDGTRSFIMYSLGNFLADQTRLVTPIPRTQYGKIVNLNIIRNIDGHAIIYHADILPTLTMRDFNGNTLRFTDDIAVLPIFNGELPEFITDPSVRNWGMLAYEHVRNIVGSEFIMSALDY